MVRAGVSLSIAASDLTLETKFQCDMVFVIGFQAVLGQVE